MSLEDLKRELAALPLGDRRSLMGFLASLNASADERRRLREKIDDKDPSRWLTLEQLDAKLAALDAEEAGA
jgi:hypothetical protein